MMLICGRWMFVVSWWATSSCKTRNCPFRRLCWTLRAHSDVRSVLFSEVVTKSSAVYFTVSLSDVGMLHWPQRLKRGYNIRGVWLAASMGPCSSPGLGTDTWSGFSVNIFWDQFLWQTKRVHQCHFQSAIIVEIYRWLSVVSFKCVCVLKTVGRHIKWLTVANRPSLPLTPKPALTHAALWRLWTALLEGKVGKGRALDIAPQVDTATTKALRYMARTKQRRTYLHYTFPAIAGTHLQTPRGLRVE